MSIALVNLLILCYRVAKAYVEKYEGRLSRSHGYQEAGAKVILAELTTTKTFSIFERNASPHITTAVNYSLVHPDCAPRHILMRTCQSVKNANAIARLPLRPSWRA